ncbi:MAG: nicotinamide mononucleotide transporter [Verrucomicrobiota bacterium]|nr:nicotinamide mononucleotide transporter [Verrucomicrobiota bacterium]
MKLGVLTAWRFNPRAMDDLRDYAFQYYGCDWAAMVFTFLSIYLLGNLNRLGFVMGIAANIFWFSYGYMTESLANMLCSMVVMLLQFRGWQKWTRESEKSIRPNRKPPDASSTSATN